MSDSFSFESFVAQAPYSDGGINSSVFATAKYASHSSFLYESEMKRIQRASTSTYLLRKCKQSKEPDLDKIMNPGNQHQTEVDESQLDSLTKALNANLNKPVQTQQTADGVSFFTLPEEVCPPAPRSSSKPVQTQQPTDGVYFFTLPEDTEAAIHTVKAVKRFAQKYSLKKIRSSTPKIRTA